MIDQSNIKRSYYFLLKYFVRYTPTLIMGSALIIVSSVMILPAPLITKRILDHSIPQKNFSELFFLIIITLLVMIILRIIAYSSRMLFLKINTKVIMDIRKDILIKICKLSFRQFHQQNPGYYISRINDDSERIQILFTDTLISVLQDILTFFVGGLAIFFIHWQLAIFVLILLPVYGCLMIFYTRKARKISKIYYENRATVNSQLSETLETFDLSKVFLNYWYNIKRYYCTAVTEFRSYIRLNKVMMANDTTVNILAGLSPLLIVGYGGYEVIHGRMTLGALIAFKSFSDYLFGPTNRLVNLNLHIQKAMISLDRINSILELPEENLDQSFPLSNQIETIELSNVKFSFNSENNPEFEFDLSFKKGDRVGIVGKSGAGKTTLIRIILGIYSINGGEYILNGKSLSHAQVINLRNNISFVEQEPQLFTDTVYQNIRFANYKATHEQIIQAAIDAHADIFIRKLEKGYDTIIGKDSLSIGEKQRLAIARALVRKPGILIFDEATSNIDPISETTVSNTINQLPKDIIVFIISHQLKSLKHCTKVIVLDSGKIVEVGTQEELISQGGLFGNLHNQSTTLYSKL